jgi:hypothetical protein
VAPGAVFRLASVDCGATQLYHDLRDRGTRLLVGKLSITEAATAALRDEFCPARAVRSTA